ncbi:MAG: hypothetical protein MK212_09445 [Saprospiraceae bacterium]|nr:hypothetical protein [Saprospiraceae bacterium]
MAKKRASKQYEEEEMQYDKMSINSEDQIQDTDELTSVNSLIPKGNINVEEDDDEQEKMKGAMLPKPKGERDPKMDEEPIEGEDLGVKEDSFLMDRKVSKEDLEAHARLEKRDFLGSNVRKPRDFAAMFGKGKSSEQNPKIDVDYSIDNNTPFRKELMAKQLLRNAHSRDIDDVKNTKRIFNEFKLEEELIDAILEDKEAYKNNDFITQLQELIPDTDM